MTTTQTPTPAASPWVTTLDFLQDTPQVAQNENAPGNMARCCPCCCGDNGRGEDNMRGAP